MVRWKDFVLSCRTFVALVVSLGLLSTANADGAVRAGSGRRGLGRRSGL